MNFSYQWVKVYISKMSNNQDIASKLSFMKFYKNSITYYINDICLCVIYDRKFNQKSICLRFYDYFLGSQLRLCSRKYSIFEQSLWKIIYIRIMFTNQSINLPFVCNLQGNTHYVMRISKLPKYLEGKCLAIILWEVWVSSSWQ